VNGAALDAAYMLNRGDPGLLKSPDRTLRGPAEVG